MNTIRHTLRAIPDFLALAILVIGLSSLAACQHDGDDGMSDVSRGVAREMAR